MPPSWTINKCVHLLVVSITHTWSSLPSQLNPQNWSPAHLAQLEAALKIAKPIQFKENIALVLQYFDQLLPLMQEQDSNLRPAD